MIEGITEPLWLLIEWIAFPGNAAREVLGVSGAEPFATVAVSLFYLTPAVLLGAAEWYLRIALDRDRVLMPDYFMAVPPDFAINTWAFLMFWGVIQGPLSAFL